MYRRKELKNKKYNVWEEGYFCVIKINNNFCVIKTSR